MHTTAVAGGEYRVTLDQDEVLLADALLTGIGIAIFDPVARVGGLLHFEFPESRANPQQAQRQPALFADTGVPLLFDRAIKGGAQKERMIVRVAGGAECPQQPGTRQVAKGNYLAMRKILWKTGVLVEREAIGGTIQRSLIVQIGTGCVVIQQAGEPVETAERAF
jgi:chemotaxis protein CheD